MNWIEIALLAAALIGVAAGGALVARSPQFWIGLAVTVAKAVWPQLLKLVAKDFTPEHAAKVAEAARTGQDMESRHGPRHKGER